MMNSYEILGYRLQLTALYPDVNNVSSIEYRTDSILRYYHVPADLEGFRIFNVTLAAYNMIGVGIEQNFCISTPSTGKFK